MQFLEVKKKVLTVMTLNRVGVGKGSTDGRGSLEGYDSLVVKAPMQTPVGIAEAASAIMLICS